MNVLPHKLKIEMSLYLHQKTYNTIFFFHDKSLSFIAWICPILRPYAVTDNEYIYFEGDEVSGIFFVLGGQCFY